MIAYPLTLKPDPNANTPHAPRNIAYEKRKKRKEKRRKARRRHENKYKKPDAQ